MTTMQGQTVLITGATAGIGKVTAIELAKMGAAVVLVGRDAHKVADTVAEIRVLPGVGQSIDGLVANLASLAGVRTLADTVKARYDHLNVLINNAGAVFMQRQTSPDGFEMTFALNHLSYFYLTLLLLDLLKNNAPARVISVSSGAHIGASLNFDDLQNTRKYTSFKAYGQSKLMNIYFTRELARRLEGSGITANCLHPGFVATNFGRSNGGIFNGLFRLTHLAAISPEEGAKTSVYLASSPDVARVNGEYFYRSKVTKTSTQAYDDLAAKRLWDISLKLINDPEIEKV
jgi:NAD(P)-dependent dehydrogenase (short-subunit alcohol dehydrogenase family)